MASGLAALADRNRQPELMDQPGLDEKLHAHALRGLSRINQICRTSAMLWAPIGRLAIETQPSRPLRILDVACGGGDVVLGLARRAVQAGIAVHVDGCDISSVAVGHATAAAARQNVSNVGFFQHDALHSALPAVYDVVACSLFLHHLENSEAEQMLRSMAAAAGRLVLASDLRRSRFAWLMTWFGSRLLTRSPIVHVDGPLSVAAAFTVEEAAEVAARAGLAGVTISPYFPERFLLEWRKPS